MPITIGQNVYFDFLYINDLVKIIEYFILNKTGHKIYNIASGKRIDLVTTAKLINGLGNFQSKITIKNPGFNFEYTADISRLKREIPDFKFTPFKLALEKLYQWYEMNLDRIDKKKTIEDPYFKYISVKK